MIVTFCGHSEIYQTDEIRHWLISTIEPLIADGADTFYLGGYGAFDSFATVVLRELKKSYPHIQSILVLAYLNREIDASDYDSTLYPELEEVPPRFAISKRNQRMVEMADMVVAYVTHGWGGAATTLQYAKRKKKSIICFPDTKAPIIKTASLQEQDRVYG